MNKRFWKFLAGFLGIVAFAILTLFAFQYWQNHEEEREFENLMKAIQQDEQNFRK